MKRADRERVEIVSLPECFLTGCPDTESLARKNAFAADGSSPQMLRLLDRTAAFDATAIVGVNEARGAGHGPLVQYPSSSDVATLWRWWARHPIC